MKSLFNFRIICFALILFGSFANFAQNLWGNYLINVMELFLALSFVTESFVIIVKRIKNKQLKRFNITLLISMILFFLFPFFGMVLTDNMVGDVFIMFILIMTVLMVTDGILAYSRVKNNRTYISGLYENYFLFFVFMGFFSRNMRWPGSSELLILGIILLIPFYISQTISFLRHNFKDGKVLVTLLSIGSIATVVLGMGLLFKRMHWPGGYQMILTGFILTGVLIVGSFKWKYNFNNQPITIFKALKLLKTQIVPVYFALFILCFHGYLASLNMAPKFYSTIRPAAVEKLRNGTQKGETDSWKLSEMYDRFVEASEKNGFVK
jgi:hypothetical protein